MNNIYSHRIAFWLVLIFFLPTMSFAQIHNDNAKALFTKSLTLLNKVGGVVTFDVPAGTELFTESYSSTMSSKEVNTILDEVIDNLKVVIGTDSTIREAYYYLGIAHLRRMDIDASINAFYKALEIEPDRETTYLILGGLLIDTEKYKEALDVASQLLKRFPRSKLLSYTLSGQTYLAMGDFDKALEFGLRIADLDSSRLEARILLASSYSCLGNLSAADEQFRLLEAYPEINVTELKKEIQEKCKEMKKIK